MRSAGLRVRLHAPATADFAAVFALVTASTPPPRCRPFSRCVRRRYVCRGRDALTAGPRARRAVPTAKHHVRRLIAPCLQKLDAKAPINVLITGAAGQIAYR